MKWQRMVRSMDTRIATWIAIAIAFSLSWVCAASVTGNVDGWDLAQRINDDNSLQKWFYDLRHLPAERRPQIAEQVKAFRKAELESGSHRLDIFYDGTLLALGDTETRTRLLKFYPNVRLAHDLRNIADPEIAAVVGDELLKGNTTLGVYDPHDNPGDLGIAWFIIRNTLISSMEFSEETKKWAEESREMIFEISPASMEAVRDWWRANREAFQAHRYKEVRPGRVPDEWRELNQLLEQVKREAQTSADAVMREREIAALKQTARSKAVWYAKVGGCVGLVVLCLLWICYRRKPISQDRHPDWNGTKTTVIMDENR